MSTAEERRAGKRTRNWAVVVYPDSAPENWREVLRDLKIQALISPLHDRDTNPDGTPKKPHYHVILIFEGVKTWQQVKEDVADRLNAPSPEKVMSVKGYARYLIHMDNPEKAQYSQEEIEVMGGVDLAELLKMTSSSRHAMLREMRKFISENSVTELCDFMDWCDANRPDDWSVLLDDNSCYIIGEYIKSQRHKLRDEMTRGV